MRLKFERECHRLESEIRSLEEQLKDRNQALTDLANHMSRRDHDLAEALKKLDADAEIKAAMLRQIRDFDDKYDDLQADLTSERQSRADEKRQHIQEIETLRGELLDRSDTKDVMLTELKRRDHEVSTLKQQVEQIHRSHETSIGELRSRHNKQLDELVDQLADTKRHLQGLSKDRQSIEGDVHERDQQISALLAQRQDWEKKRRQLEGLGHELQAKLSESERIKQETLEKLQRYSQETDTLNAAYIDVEHRAKNHLQRISALEADNHEWQEKFQDENRQKLNVQSKLRQAEDLVSEYKDELDERDQQQEKINGKWETMLKQNNELRRQVEQSEEARRKLQLDKDTLIEDLDQTKLSAEKLQKSTRKHANDLNDLNAELESYRLTIQNVNRDRRTFEKRIHEAELAKDISRQERDQMEQALRERETQCLTLTKELDEQKDLYEAVEKRLRKLQAEYVPSNGTDINTVVRDLERSKRTLGE